MTFLQFIYIHLTKMVAIVLAFVLFVGICNGTPGAASSPSRIVGGSPTTIQNYPSIVQINHYVASTNYWNHNCGGNILTPNAVLSAAHCFNPHVLNFHSIRAGATVRDVGGVIVLVSSVLVHPEYNNYPPTTNADIAIARLASSLIFGNTINSIAIPPQDYVVPGNSPGIYAGWGFNYEGTDNLLHVNVNIVSHDECERRYGGRVNADLICAGYNGTDACNGDSGGPLYFGGVLVGIVSFGPWPCGHPTQPGVAIRTASHSNWIVNNA